MANSPLRLLTDDAQPRMVVANQLAKQEAEQALRGDSSQFQRGWRAGLTGISAGAFANDAISGEKSATPYWQADRDIGLRMAQESAEIGPRVSSLRDISGVGDALDWAGGALGQGTASMAPTVAAALLTRGRGNALGRASSFAGAMVPAYQMEKGEAVLGQYADPTLAAASVEDRDRVAMAKGVGNAVLESVVPAGLAGSVLRKPTSSFLGAVGRNMLTEGATEAAQQYGGHLAEKALDPNRQLDPMSLVDAAAMGALTGGGVSAVGLAPTHAVNAMGERAARLLPPDAAASPTPDAPTPSAPTPDAPTPDAPTPASPAQELYENLSERFGPKVEETYGKASDFVGGVVDRMNEAVKTAENPQDFLRQVFRPSSEAAATADLQPDEADPGVLNSPDPAAAMQQRDADRIARAAGFAEELLNDPATPSMVKDRISAMGGDYSSRSNRTYVASTLAAMKGGRKIVDAVGDFVEFSKTLADKAAGKSSRKNLQDINEADIAPLVSVLAQRLGPVEAGRAPKLAKQLIAAANRLSPDAKINEDVDRRLRNFSEAIDDDVLDTVTQLSGSDALRNSISKIRSIPSAVSDVRQSGGQSFLESMLKQPLEPAMLGQLADFVDATGLQLSAMPSGRKNQVLGGLAAAFGSKREAQTVVEYYGNIKREAFRREAEAGKLHEDRVGEVTEMFLDQPGRPADATYEGAASTAEWGALSENDGPGTEVGFREKASKRPFRKFAGERLSSGSNRREAWRAINDERGRVGDADYATQDYSEYLAAQGIAPEEGLSMVRRDIEGRIKGHESRKGEDRRAMINELRGELELLETTASDKGAKAALDQYEVITRSKRAANDVVASDDDIKMMKTAARAKPETVVQFRKVDGSVLKLSADSMVKTLGLARQKKGGVVNPQRQNKQQMFADAAASVLARDDIAGLISDLKKVVLDPDSGHTVERTYSKDRLAALSEFEALLDKNHKGVPARRAYIKAQLAELEEALDALGDPTSAVFDAVGLEVLEDQWMGVTEQALKRGEQRVDQLDAKRKEALAEYLDNKNPENYRAFERARAMFDYARGAVADYREFQKAASSLFFDVRREIARAEKSGVPEGNTNEPAIMRTSESVRSGQRAQTNAETDAAIAEDPNKFEALDRYGERDTRRTVAGVRRARAQKERVSKQSFVGAKADPEGAAEASEALDSGASAKLVWAMHGWFRGPDGMMRKELRSPVLRARVHEFAKNLLGQRLGTAKAEFEGVSADQLFDGVPGYEKLLKTLGKYTISLEDSPEVGLYGMVGVVADSTLTMSVDGAGLQAVLRKYAADELTTVVDDGVLDPTDMFSSARDAVREGYLPKFESVEAFEREVLAGLEKSIHHELQHILQGVEGFENGGNPNVAIVSKYGDIRAFESAFKDGDHSAAMEALERARSAMLADIGPDADPEAVAHDLYRNIMGEVEAHDVEARFNLSDAEAKRILPEMMNPNREFLRGVKVAIDAAKLAGKQNRQTTIGNKRKPPNAKEHAELKKKLVDEIRRIRGNDVRVRFNRLIKNLGASGEFSMNPDKTDRLIEVAVNAADPLGVAWHESLHDFFAMLGEDKVGRSIKRDLTDAANAPHVKKRLRELLKDHPKALEQIEKSPEERVAYMYQFWAAGELQLGTTGTGIFEQLRQFFRDLLHVVGRDERAADLLTALHEGKFADPSTVAEVLADMPRDRVFNRLERTAPALTDTLQKLAKVAPDRLRAYQNEHLDRLADMFSSESGELGFVQRRFRRDGEWTNKLAGILAGTKAAERRKALDNLQAMKAPSSKLERDLAKFFEDMHGYMLEAGVQTLDSKTKKWVPIRQVKNYFPRVFDRDAILKDREGFKSLLLQHGNMTAKAAENTVKALTHGTGQLDLAENEHALGFTPYAQSVQDRQLTFINPSNAAAFAKYQSKDLADITTMYVKQAVHRAEYARLFGNQGEKISQTLIDSGITDKKDLADIEKTVQGLEGSLGYEMSSQTKELMSGVMTLQNLVILPLAIFSQMIDPVVLAARSGEVKDAGNAYVTAIKRMVGKDVDGEDLAEVLGIISQDTVLDAMGVAYGTTHMSKRMRNINRVFFKYNGMQGWNNSMRIAATAAGERYLLQNKDNAEALAELGLKPGDVKVIQTVGLRGMRDGIDTSSTKVKEAMFRFVDQAVLRPSASNRPVWMSDPKFLLLAHLKQFTFAMHNVVLKRANQQLDEGNPKPWAILMLAMPTILAADMAKFALTGGPPPGWGFKEFLAHAVERSGLLGLGDFGAQAMKGVEQGRVPGEALLGPSVEHLMDLLRFLGGSPTVSSGDVLDRSVPGARFL